MPVDHIEMQSSASTCKGPMEGVCQGSFGAVWLEGGELRVNDAPVESGRPAFFRAGDRFRVLPEGDGRWVRFELGAETFACEHTESIDVPAGPALLRLDQVEFPPRAVAYRHVHPGPGFRVLVAGALEIISDHHRESMRPGDIWFEPAHSPVRAEAGESEALTSFVRFLVLPIEFEGKPTIQILDADEAKLPRLQATKRHLEEVVRFPPG